MSVVILNDGVPEQIVVNAQELAARLRILVRKLYAKHVEGKAVAYDAIKADLAFAEYASLAKSLQNIDCNHMSRDETIAFFLNVYNALIVHATIEGGNPGGDEREKFFNDMRYNIGGETYSLNEIENGILRGNKPGSGKNKELPFAENDPRLKISVKGGDPRVHFAMNCGAKGCPMIRAYSPEKIDSELDAATALFLSDEANCAVKDGKLFLSEIFNWYKSDFGNNDDEMAQFVASHIADGDNKAKLEELLKRHLIVDYLPYDFTSNSA